VAKSKKKKSAKDAKDQERKAAAKAQAKAAAKAAALAAEAKKARKAADKAVAAADKAQAKAVAAGAPAPKQRPDEAELLRLALRSAEARLTDAERKVERLEGQIADLHRLDEQEAEEAVAEALVEEAVAATVADAVLDAELAADATTTAAEEAEAVATELDEIAAEAAPEPEAPSGDGDAAEAARTLAASDPGAEPTVVKDELTPPLPEQPTDGEPNESWTLVRLRQEAKQRGLTGTSNLPKAALLERLRD
jgi:hypothetical protein